jgi:hypothetical protein
LIGSPSHESDARREVRAVRADELLRRIIDELAWDLGNEEHQFGKNGLKRMVQLATTADTATLEVETYGGTMLTIAVAREAQPSSLKGL